MGAGDRSRRPSGGVYILSFIGPPQQSKEHPSSQPQVVDDDEGAGPHSLHSFTTFSSNPQLSHT
jgi:hypothetical protein